MNTSGLELLSNTKNEYLKLWWDTPSDFPVFEKQFTARQQKLKGKEMESLLDRMAGILKESLKYDDDQNRRMGTGAAVRSLIRLVGKNVLELEDRYLDIILDGGFTKTSSDFISSARAFDSSIRLDDIMQAMRNVWIMNCIQILLGREVSYSPSVFGYSMLYPYTDNVMDAPGLSGEEKKRTFAGFGRKLAGEPVIPSNQYERALFKLVELIESQYPRQKYRDVYNSLLAIFYAQQASLGQQKKDVSPYETDILGLSFEKGGTSVLADAFLVNGTLSPQQIHFMFGFGIFLQLADDLQDAGIDRKNGHMTMFSQSAGKWPLDKAANKLFNFTAKILDSDVCFTSEQMKDMKNVIKDNCSFLLLAAIAQNSRLFSREYIKRIEAYSPLSFFYMKRVYEKLGQEYDTIKKSAGGTHAEEAIAAVLAQ